MTIADLISKLSQFPIDSQVAIYDGDSGFHVPVVSVQKLDPRYYRDLGLWPNDSVVVIGD